jgi:hypothetical protein
MLVVEDKGVTYFCQRLEKPLVWGKGSLLLIVLATHDMSSFEQ